jgi:hypothetical protein
MRCHDPGLAWPVMSASRHLPCAGIKTRWNRSSGSPRSLLNSSKKKASSSKGHQQPHPFPAHRVERQRSYTTPTAGASPASGSRNDKKPRGKRRKYGWSLNTWNSTGVRPRGTPANEFQETAVHQKKKDSAAAAPLHGNN